MKFWVHLPGLDGWYCVECIINFYMVTFQADQDQILFLIGTGSAAIGA